MTATTYDAAMIRVFADEVWPYERHGPPIRVVRPVSASIIDARKYWKANGPLFGQQAGRLSVRP
jgi:hypothetical protein